MDSIQIRVSKIIAAKPVQVFQTWIDSKQPGGPWFGVEKAILQPRVDGFFYHLVHHEGHDWAHYGRFIEIVEPTRIVHTWVSEATSGVETLVTIELRAHDDGTHIELTHDRVPDTQLGRQHEMGWNYVLDSLKTACEKRANG